MKFHRKRLNQVFRNGVEP